MRIGPCPVMVGRERELALLDELLNGAARGAGGFVALVGEPGVGKSRLARETLERAGGRGLVTLSGRAVPGEARTPFRPLTEALLVAFRASGPPHAPELADVGGQLARVVPEWAIGARATPVEVSPIVVGEAVVRLLRTMGRGRGCVLLIEDLHWADPDTLAVADYFADTLGSEPVLCVATSRPRAADDVAGLIERARARPPATVIDVAPLIEADVGDDDGTVS